MRAWLSRAASCDELHSLVEEAEGKHLQDGFGELRCNRGSRPLNVWFLTTIHIVPHPPQGSLLIRRTLHAPYYEYSLKRNPIAIMSTRNKFNLESLNLSIL